MKIKQRDLINTPVYQAITRAAERMREPREYDIATKDERALAILCWSFTEAARLEAEGAIECGLPGLLSVIDSLELVPADAE